MSDNILTGGDLLQWAIDAYFDDFQRYHCERCAAWDACKDRRSALLCLNVIEAAKALNVAGIEEAIRQKKEVAIANKALKGEK